MYHYTKFGMALPFIMFSLLIGGWPINTVNGEVQLLYSTLNSLHPQCCSLLY